MYVCRVYFFDFTEKNPTEVPTVLEFVESWNIDLSPHNEMEN